MKMLGISGSLTKGDNNDKVILHVIDAAKSRGFGVDTVFLSLSDIAPCNACGSCSSGGACAIKDDMQVVYDKLVSADVIIVSSPVYFGTVSAQLKAFFDRSVMLRRHGFLLKNKVGSAIAVCGSRNGGQEKTIPAVHDWMHIHGMAVISGGNHFSGILQKPALDDDVDMKTVDDIIDILCSFLEKFKN
ncbi:MAG: flavodoxin family protein [Nanohaloarchaea archaeon]|nr:flavodoxin family protein [Candidatus Nanohaloarchaea archaeon]